MSNPLIQTFRLVCPVSPHAANEIFKLITVNHYKKGYHLLELWQISRHFHFIHKGSARVYYLRDGLDVTDYIAMDMQFIGGVESLFTQQPSHKAIELTEDSEVHSFLYADFEKLCEQYHEIEHLARKMTIFGFLEGQKRIESIRFLSAAQRYQELEKQYPGITNRIPLKHIASYLGTTPVSLSRIRGGVQ